MVEEGEFSPVNKILDAIHHRDVYEGFSPVASELSGWGGNDPIFDRLIGLVLPTVIIEVGSWKGQSAITMAKSCRSKHLQTAIICVDTWLGSEEHLFEFSNEIQRENGFPTLYRQFLSNVVREGVQEFIVPLPCTSAIAAAALKRLGINAKLVYLDSDHHYEATLADLEGFFPLLDSGGIIFGHDFSWNTVSRAVSYFCTLHTRTFSSEGEFWIINQ